MKRRKSMRSTRHKNTNDPQRSTALERSENILLEGLNQFHGANLTLSSDVWFARKTHSLSMHHLQKHINQDIKRR